MQVLSRSMYRYVCVICFFIQTLNLAFFNLPQHFAYYLLIPYGMIVLGYELWTHQSDSKNYSVTWLMMFLLCCGISTYTSIYSNKRSYLLLILQGLIFLLVFAQSKNTTIYEMRREMIQLLRLVCVLTFLASFLSLLTFVFNISLTRNGVPFGLVGNRLFGIYFNCNPASFLACMSICASSLLLYLKSRFPYLHIMNIGVQALYVLLSNCRTAFLILLGLLMVVVYYFLFKRKDYRRITNIGIAFCIGFLALFGGRIIKEGLFLIPKLQGAVMKEESRFSLDDVVEIIWMLKENPIGNASKIYHLANDISSRRVELYYDAYKLYKTNPVTGIGMGNFKLMGLDLFQDSSMFKGSTIVHAHNLFLEVLVVSGALGFFCFMLFLGRAAVRMFENLRRYQYTSSYFIILFMSAIVCVEFIGSMMDYGVLYDYSLSALLFWIVLGYLFCINQNKKAKLHRSSYAFELLSYDLIFLHYDHIPSEEVKMKIVDAKFSDQLCLTVQFEAGDFVAQYHGYYDVYVEEEELKDQYHNMLVELYEVCKEDWNVLTPLPFPQAVYKKV